MSQEDRHLTTEQLSTWLDQQLTPKEQAYCSAHLEACELCQDVLDNLQETVNLLQSLPQLEVPHSFTLPADFKLTPDGNKQQQFGQSTATSHRRLPTPLRRTLRAVSTLAAVIGLFFALSGFVATFQPHPEATNTSSISLPQAHPILTRNPSSNANEARGQQNPSTETVSTATWPILPFLDFNQPGTRLSIGIPLVILGGTGFTLFAQRRKQGPHPIKKPSS